MFNNFFFKKVLVLSGLVFLYSCDKEYNTIGGDLLQGNHFTFEKYTSNVVAFNEKLDSIQSNNQEINPLGIYEDPDFGTTTANFVTQLSLASVNPTIINASTLTVKSVVLSIPYSIDANQTVTNTANYTYVLDSIYGDVKGKFKLGVYRTGYYLGTADPSVSYVDPLRFYTYQNSFFDSRKFDGIRLNDAVDTKQNDEFLFSNPDRLTGTTSPTMLLNLNAAYFKKNVMDVIALGTLKTNDVFMNYFKGLYFQVEKIGSTSTALSMLNFYKGTVTINYTDATSTSDATPVAKTLVLNMTGNTVSLLEQSNVPTKYKDAISSPNVNTNVGDSRLYLKGGVGSMAVIKLFEDSKLAALKNNGWLVNEANLILHVDDASLTGVNKPQRLYLYDLNNTKTLIDFSTDATTGTTAKKGQTTFGGILTKDVSGKSYYKFRITNHVRNLLTKDSTNVKLGLVVTENISNITSAKLATATSWVKQIPQASVMNPLGVVLFGNNIPATDPNYDKRLKLEIYYTKPN